MSKQRIFEVGDKVRAPRFKGVLEVSEVREVDAYPVVVWDRAANALLRYTACGKAALSDSEPTLRHAETGIQAIVGEPPERFEYPLYMESKHGLIVKFTDMCTATVIQQSQNAVCDDSGVSSTSYRSHTDRDIWTPCDKPKWKPTKPTWCWVWDTYRASKVLLLVIEYCDHPVGTPSETDYNYVVCNLSSSRTVYRNAEPCGAEDIPDYWPKEWM